MSIAVGDIRDYTGKNNQNEGFAITQGGSLMAYSALGKMKPGVVIHERFDTRIADAELAYMTNRQLGDGNTHKVDGPDGPDGVASEVPWKPYFGGTVLQSGYYIVGGITEVNYNIQSGGGHFLIGNVGPRSRTYVMNVAVDLRIVGTQSLKVFETVSVQKQIIGYEVGAGLFQFFGNNLFDIEAGMKNQEPLQLGVRMAIEDAILQLVASVSKKDLKPCMVSS
jgi:curli biogenesis system outer membrane secretion channel CsgG